MENGAYLTFEQFQSRLSNSLRKYDHARFVIGKWGTERGPLELSVGKHKGNLVLYLFSSVSASDAGNRNLFNRLRQIPWTQKLTGMSFDTSVADERRRGIKQLGHIGKFFPTPAISGKIVETCGDGLRRLYDGWITVQKVVESYGLISDVGGRKSRHASSGSGLKSEAPTQYDEPADCKERIAELKASLVYAMSNGSHELFHSNVWAWLIGKDEKFIKVFFPDFKGKFTSVMREQGNRDVTVWAEVDGQQKAYVIENKFKSSPREDQLKDYQQELGPQFHKGLLTCLVKPKGSENWEWSVKTQEEIADGLVSVLAESTLSDFEKVLVRSYACMTKNMGSILLRHAVALGDRWPTQVVRSLDGVRLYDIFAKIKAADLVNYIEAQPETAAWRTAAERLGCELRVLTGFARKFPTADVQIVKYRLDVDNSRRKKVVLAIGMQIQGTAYERMVCTELGGQWLYCRPLFDMFVKAGWFEDESFLSLATKRSRKDYNKYETRDYRFVYQKIDLIRAGADDFRTIFERLKVDMKKAFEVVTKRLITEVESGERAS